MEQNADQEILDNGNQSALNNQEKRTKAVFKLLEVKNTPKNKQKNENDGSAEPAEVKQGGQKNGNKDGKKK